MFPNMTRVLESLKLEADNGTWNPSLWSRPWSLVHFLVMINSAYALSTNSVNVNYMDVNHYKLNTTK